MAWPRPKSHNCDIIMWPFTGASPSVVHVDIPRSSARNSDTVSLLIYRCWPDTAAVCESGLENAGATKLCPLLRCWRLIEFLPHWRKERAGPPCLKKDIIYRKQTLFLYLPSEVSNKAGRRWLLNGPHGSPGNCSGHFEANTKYLGRK